MAVQTKYNLVYGTANEVKSPFGRDRSPLLAADSIQVIEPGKNIVNAVRSYVRACESDSRRSPLFVPRFIGIVEAKEITKSGSPERFALEVEDALNRIAAASNFGYQVASLVQQNVDDGFEPNLIHLTYSPDSGMNRALLAECFGGFIPKRVVVSPLHALPHFYDKTPDSALNLCERLAELVHANKPSREIRRAIASEVEVVRKEMETYGATVVEYNTFLPIDTMHKMTEGLA